MFDSLKDPLPWLNCCDQFIHIQDTLDVDKVFVATFYMMDGELQWYTLLEQNRSKPSSEEFVKLVNQWFGPLDSNALGELIQLRWDGFVAKF
jgi:hypothetical protein